MIREPVLILGAGINGAAIAREFLLNGVSVYVVDRADIASGATAYSSRLIHGGLRYLEHGEFGLVRESLAERTRLLELAADYITPLRFYIPVAHRWTGWVQAASRFLGLPNWSQRHVPRGLLLVGTGLRFYDLFARDATLPGRSIHRAGAAELPSVHPRYRWLCSYYDAQMAFPERFVVGLLDDARRVAVARGLDFKLLTYHRVRLQGPRAEVRRCTAGGDVVAELQPWAVVNATGSWVDDALLELPFPSSRRLMGGTKGSHFVTFHSGLHRALGGAGIYAEAPDGRPIFILPWQSGTLVGTTDLPFRDDASEATATEEELEYLVGAVNDVFPALRLQSSDIALHYAGVRPLPFVDESTPAAITRRHWVESHGGQPPVFSIIGGKLTTCRSLAEQAVATVLAQASRQPEANSRARRIRGARGDAPPTIDAADLSKRLAEQSQLQPEQIAAIWPLCAAPAAELLLGANGEPAAAAERESVVDTHIPRHFVRAVLRREWVTRLEDLVERRLMLLYDQRLSVRCLEELADLMADEGIIPSVARAAEVAQCRQRLAAHYGRRLA